MAFTADDVLQYLSWQGFGIKVPNRELSYSLTEWNNPPINNIPTLGIETEGKVREVIVTPLYRNKNLMGEYTWKPGIIQLFSRLEVTAENDGSLLVVSPSRLFFGGNFSGEGYYQLHLLRTKQD